MQGVEKLCVAGELRMFSVPSGATKKNLVFIFIYSHGLGKVWNYPSVDTFIFSLVDWEGQDAQF